MLSAAARCSYRRADTHTRAPSPKALAALEQTAARFGPVTPIVSETVASTDTRFGAYILFPP